MVQNDGKQKAIINLHLQIRVFVLAAACNESRSMERGTDTHLSVTYFNR